MQELRPFVAIPTRRTSVYSLKLTAVNMDTRTIELKVEDEYLFRLLRFHPCYLRVDLTELTDTHEEDKHD
jgi:hypothetical protein